LKIGPLVFCSAPRSKNLGFLLRGALSRQSTRYIKQAAQLSQRDRAAGCVIVLAKSGRLELGDNILRTYYRSIFNH